MTELRLPALEIRQGPSRVFYTFAVDGKLLPRFATISRIRRSQDGALGGYQRPEVVSHIAQIRDYLESDRPLIPKRSWLPSTSVRFERKTQRTTHRITAGRAPWLCHSRQATRGNQTPPAGSSTASSARGRRSRDARVVGIPQSVSPHLWLQRSRNSASNLSPGELDQAAAERA